MLTAVFAKFVLVALMGRQRLLRVQGMLVRKDLLVPNAQVTKRQLSDWRRNRAQTHSPKQAAVVSAHVRFEIGPSAACCLAGRLRTVEAQEKQSLFHRLASCESDRKLFILARQLRWLKVFKVAIW